MASKNHHSVVHTDTLARTINRVHKSAVEQAKAEVLAIIEQQDRARQLLEDQRANHRNLNRFMTLVGAIVIGIFVTFTISHAGIPQLGWQLSPSLAKAIAPYSFLITIAMDSSLAAYAFIRKY